jgi:hypothetical protein
VLVAGAEAGVFSGLPQEGEKAVGMLLDINLFWGLMNLLPVWPLDGGQICRELCTASSRGNGVRTSLIISIVVAGFVAINSFLAHNGSPHVPYIALGSYGAFLFAILAINNFLELKELSRRDAYWDSGPRW